jgi:hypothetical protein
MVPAIRRPRRIRARGCDRFAPAFGSDDYLVQLRAAAGTGAIALARFRYRLDLPSALRELASIAPHQPDTPRRGSSRSRSRGSPVADLLAQELATTMRRPRR